MRRNPRTNRPATDAELLDAIAAAGLDKHWSDRTEDDRRRLDRLVADLGHDAVTLARAQMRATRRALGLER